MLFDIFKASNQIKSSQKSFFFFSECDVVLHACATCSEFQSYKSSMPHLEGSVGVRIRGGSEGYLGIRGILGSKVGATTTPCLLTPGAFNPLEGGALAGAPFPPGEGGKERGCRGLG